MPIETILQRFGQTESRLQNDPHLHQIIILHGPFDLDYVYDEKIFYASGCLACQVLWPCRTFEIFEERMLIK